MAPWRIVGQLIVAASITAFYITVPLAVILLLPYIRLVPYSLGGVILPVHVLVLLVRLALANIILISGLSTSLGAFIAPPTKISQYAVAPLPFCLALFCILAAEAMSLPAFFRAWPPSFMIPKGAPAHLLIAGGVPFRMLDFLWALPLAAVAAGIGRWAGIRLRSYPQSVLAHIFNKWRTMQIGNNFGKPIRLHLDEVA